MTGIVVLALLLAKVNTTELAAISSIVLAAAAFVRSVTIDPRSSRLAERKENAELRKEVQDLYVGKREAEDREREALRRLDKAERKIELQEHHIARITGELDGANARIIQLTEDARKWRMIVEDLRPPRQNP